MEFILLLRSFRVHEIPIEPSNKSLEGGNFLPARHSQNENTDQLKQVNKITDDQCKSTIIYVIPYNPYNQVQ